MRSNRDHENTHARVARRLGYSAKVNIREGYTEVSERLEANPIHAAAVALGPAMHGAPESHTGRDRRAAQEYIDRLPRRERKAAMREAESLARKHGRR